MTSTTHLRLLAMSVCLTSACGASPSGPVHATAEAGTEAPSDPGESATPVTEGGSEASRDPGLECTGTLDLAGVQQVAFAHNAAILACYNARADHSQTGELTLRLRIAPDGHVDDVQAYGPLRRTDIAACALAAWAEAQFSETSGGCVTMVIPYSFHLPETPAPTPP